MSCSMKRSMFIDKKTCLFHMQLYDHTCMFSYSKMFKEFKSEVKNANFSTENPLRGPSTYYYQCAIHFGSFTIFEKKNLEQV